MAWGDSCSGRRARHDDEPDGPSNIQELLKQIFHLFRYSADKALNNVEWKNYVLYHMIIYDRFHIFASPSSIDDVTRPTFICVNHVCILRYLCF